MVVHPTTEEIVRGSLVYVSVPNSEYLFLFLTHPALPSIYIEVWRVSKGSKFPRAGKALCTNPGRMSTLTVVPTPP